MTAIWEWYARCYDSVATLRPYREMVGTVIGAAGSEPPGRVLDAGCGTGNVTAAAREAWPYARIVAVDRSPAMLSRARRKVSGATFVRGDLDGDLSEIGGLFDVIVCVNVLYAVADPGHTLGVLREKLAPGGRLVVTTPRAGVAMGPIVRAAGWGAVLRRLGPMLLVGIINAGLLRDRAHHFLTRDELARLAGTDRIHDAYAGQNWLVVLEVRP